MKTINYFFVAVAFILLGCADDGEPGPKGEQGEKGTANVVYSPWLQPEWNVTDQARLKIMKIIAPDVTQSLLDNGTILVYWKYTAEGDLSITFPLPYTEFNSLGVPYLNWTFSIYGVGNIEVQMTSYGIDLNYFDYVNLDNNRLRYVLIPGEASSTNGRFAPAVNYSNYEAVKDYYNIPD